MSVDRDEAAGREQAVIDALDAIVARRDRGEITPEEAEALNDDVLRRAYRETTAWVRTTQEGRAHQRRLRTIAVFAAVVMSAVVVALLRR